MTKIIHFHSPDTVEIMEGSIQGGMLIAHGHPLAWELKDVESLKLIKRGLFREKSEPLFITTWNAVRPANVRHEVIEEINKIKEKISPESKPEKVHKVKLETVVEKYNNPESFYKTITLRILGNMLKYRRPVSPIIMGILGILIGFAIAYMMIGLGLIRVV